MSKKQFVLISAGGTGGHMSPASALASELIERGVRVELVTDVRGAKYISMFPEVPVHILRSGTAHPGILGKIKGAIKLAMGMMQGLSLVKKYKPDVVVGFGGYPSVPAVYAAQLMGVPTGVHEQNAIIGKANVFLASKAKFVALSLPLPEGMKFSDHVTSKSNITGNPVRPEIVALKDVKYPKLDEKVSLNILVMGGSLGATVFSEVVPEALNGLSDDQKKRINIVQQCRKADIEEAKAIYDKSGIENVTLAPFFDDVDKKLKQAHFFIGRSGASTVAEMSIAGRPAIYVPYPHHKDQQQKRNAANVADKGGAWIIDQKDFTVDDLKVRIEGFLNDPKALPDAAAHAKECGLPAAAKSLADLCLGITDNK